MLLAKVSDPELVERPESTPRHCEATQWLWQSLLFFERLARRSNLLFFDPAKPERSYLKNY